ncbi:MAG: FHA domain-containing protein [Microbacteriaceae bacterium]|jgi:pSer/pThr/pTyr-binding forkhead associated (FHA) protein
MSESHARDNETPDPSHERSSSTTANFGAAFLNQLHSVDSVDLTAEEVESIAALPSGSALLIVRRGPGAGSRFLLDQDASVAGRHSEADIFLDDVTVSRRHASFNRAGSLFSVSDLGSLNGTYVNGEIVENSSLADGDEVQVGKYRLTFFASRVDKAASLAYGAE